MLAKIQNKRESLRESLKCWNCSQINKRIISILAGGGGGGVHLGRFSRCVTGSCDFLLSLPGIHLRALLHLCISPSCRKKFR